MTEFFKVLGIYSSILLAFATFFVFITKSVIKLFLDKDIEKYKSKLIQENQIAKLQLDKDIEAFKAALNKNSYKHSKLHDIRIEVTGQISEKIGILELNLRNLIRGLRFSTGDNEKDKQQEFEEQKKTSDLYNDFLEYYFKKRVYLPVAICTILDELRTEAFSCLWEYDVKNKFGKDDPKYGLENYQSAAKRATETIPTIRETLENEFRDLIKAD